MSDEDYIKLEVENINLKKKVDELNKNTTLFNSLLEMYKTLINEYFQAYLGIRSSLVISQCQIKDFENKVNELSKSRESAAIQNDTVI